MSVINLEASVSDEKIFYFKFRRDLVINQISLNKGKFSVAYNLFRFELFYIRDLFIPNHTVELYDKNDKDDNCILGVETTGTPSFGGSTILSFEFMNMFEKNDFLFHGRSKLRFKKESGLMARFLVSEFELNKFNLTLEVS